MHDGQGVGDFVQERAASLAQLGYAALATDMFGGGKRHTNPAESTPVVMALRKDVALLRCRIVTAFEAFRGLPEVDADRIGAIGFCFGGQCVLELARSGSDAKGVVSFHGTLGTKSPATPGSVKAKVLALTGALDPYVPAKDVEAFQAEMAGAGVEWQLTVYGSGRHGFTDPISDNTPELGDAVGYSALLDKLSWAQALSFLDATVKGGAARSG
jgi:dienelactone hydrolase